MPIIKAASLSYSEESIITESHGKRLFALLRMKDEGKLF